MTREIFFPIFSAGFARWRRWLLSGWIGICLLGMVGCAAAPSPVVMDGVNLVAAAPAGVEAEALQAAAEVYQQATGQVVQVRVMGQDVYRANLEASLLAGRADIDLAYLPAGQLARWVRYQAIQPVMAETAAADQPHLRTISPWLVPLTFDGQVYGYPTQAGVEAVWYRTDLVEPAGTWEDFLQAAQAVSTSPDRPGMALAYGDGSEFLVLLPAVGGQVFTAPQDDPPTVEMRLAQPEALRALTLYAQLGEGGLTVSGEANAGRASVAFALQEGRAAFGILPATLARSLLDCEASPKACTPADPGPATPLLAFAPLPGLPSGSVVAEEGAWVIPLHAAHAQSARDFGAWLVGPAGARVWALNGGIPVSGDLVDDPQLVEQAPYLRLLAGVNEVRSAFPPVLTGDEVALALEDGALNVITHRQTPQTALDEMQSAVRRALVRGGYQIK